MSSDPRGRLVLRTSGAAGSAPPHPAADGPGRAGDEAPAGEFQDGSGSYEPGQPVRWRRDGGSRWRYGHLGDDPVEPDGGLRVYEDHNGAARTLRPSQVERLVRGPRGGQRWQPCEPTPPAPVPSPLERLQTTAVRTARAEPKGLGL